MVEIRRIYTTEHCTIVAAGDNRHIETIQHALAPDLTYDPLVILYDAGEAVREKDPELFFKNLNPRAARLSNNSFKNAVVDVSVSDLVLYVQRHMVAFDPDRTETPDGKGVWDPDRLYMAGEPVIVAKRWVPADRECVIDDAPMTVVDSKEILTSRYEAAREQFVVRDKDYQNLIRRIEKRFDQALAEAQPEAIKGLMKQAQVYAVLISQMRDVLTRSGEMRTRPRLESFL